jgi:hypothetical protein
VKRYLFTITSFAFVVAVVFTVHRSGQRHEEYRGNPAAVDAADVPVPIQFRQNQPRHWRYVMLSQSR